MSETVKIAPLVDYGPIDTMLRDGETPGARIARVITDALMNCRVKKLDSLDSAQL